MHALLKGIFHFIANFFPGHFYVRYKKVIGLIPEGYCIALFVALTTSLFYSTSLNSQDVYKEVRAGWLQKAEQTRPGLFETNRQPVSLVTLVKDEKAFQHWKVMKSGPVDSLYSNSFKKQSGVVVDFGEHLTGYFSFSVEDFGTSRRCSTAYQVHIWGSAFGAGYSI